MRRINSCLNKQLVDLCQRAVQLDELGNKVNQWLPDNLRAHCRVGSFARGCLLIVVDQADWATELRYCLPTLRDNLRQNAGVYQLTSIKIQIAADAPMASLDKRQKAKTTLSMSRGAREACRKTGELCSYEPLKTVLLNLARE
jgi:hypothetical protein